MKLWISSLILGGLAFAAGPSPDAEPAMIEAKLKSPELSAAGLQRVEADFRNLSAKPISAYAVVLRLKNEAGRTESRFTKTIAVRGVMGSRARPDFAPGEAWSEAVGEFTLQQGGVGKLRPELEVDYVLFADGTAWGPDKTKHSLYIQGLRAGRQAPR